MRRPQNDPTLAGDFEGLKADYAAAKQTRFRRRRTGIIQQGTGADWHYRIGTDYLRMIEYARDMDRNDAIIGQMVDRAVLNTVQGGFTPDPQTGDDGLDAELLARFTEWSSNPQLCDAAGEMTFPEMQEHTLRATLVDGDIFAIPLQDGPLQLVEAHRCRTPQATKRNVINGVWLDENRRRLEYWFTKDDIDAQAAGLKFSDIQRYPAFDKQNQPAIFHVFNPKRVSQTRGVTAFAPIFDVCGMFEDINFAKLVQQQVVSCFAIFRERAPTFDKPSPGKMGSQVVETLGDGSSRLVEGIAPGMVIDGAPGEKLQGFSPNVPNNEYFAHVKLILTIVGVNLGLPFVMVMMDASDTNFSGWRGAIDQARMGFRRNQRWLRDRFHNKVYRWKVRQFAADDAGIRRAMAAKGVNGFAHRWSSPRWPYVQPLHDAQADDLRQRSLQISPRRLAAEHGADATEIIEETVADNGFAIRAAITESQEIGDETGVDVDWRDLLFLSANREATPAGNASPLGKPVPPDGTEGAAPKKKPVKKPTDENAVDSDEDESPTNPAGDDDAD